MTYNYGRFTYCMHIMHSPIHCFCMKNAASWRQRPPYAPFDIRLQKYWLIVIDVHDWNVDDSDSTMPPFCCTAIFGNHCELVPTKPFKVKRPTCKQFAFLSINFKQRKVRSFPKSFLHYHLLIHGSLNYKFYHSFPNCCWCLCHFIWYEIRPFSPQSASSAINFVIGFSMEWSSGTWRLIRHAFERIRSGQPSTFSSYTTCSLHPMKVGALSFTSNTLNRIPFNNSQQFLSAIGVAFICYINFLLFFFFYIKIELFKTSLNWKLCNRKTHGRRWLSNTNAKIKHSFTASLSLCSSYYCHVCCVQWSICRQMKCLLSSDNASFGIHREKCWGCVVCIDNFKVQRQKRITIDANYLGNKRANGRILGYANTVKEFC